MYNAVQMFGFFTLMFLDFQSTDNCQERVSAIQTTINVQIMASLTALCVVCKQTDCLRPLNDSHFPRHFMENYSREIKKELCGYNRGMEV